MWLEGRGNNRLGPVGHGVELGVRPHLPADGVQQKERLGRHAPAGVRGRGVVVHHPGDGGTAEGGFEGKVEVLRDRPFEQRIRRAASSGLKYSPPAARTAAPPMLLLPAPLTPART